MNKLEATVTNNQIVTGHNNCLTGIQYSEGSE